MELFSTSSPPKKEDYFKALIPKLHFSQPFNSPILFLEKFLWFSNVNKELRNITKKKNVSHWYQTLSTLPLFHSDIMIIVLKITSRHKSLKSQSLLWTWLTGGNLGCKSFCIATMAETYIQYFAFSYSRETIEALCFFFFFFKGKLIKVFSFQKGDRGNIQYFVFWTNFSGIEQKKITLIPTLMQRYFNILFPKLMSVCILLLFASKKFSFFSTLNLLAISKVVRRKWFKRIICTALIQVHLQDRAEKPYFFSVVWLRIYMNVSLE